MSLKVGGMPLAIFIVLVAVILLICTCVFCMLRDKIFGRRGPDISDIGKRGRDIWMGKEEAGGDIEARPVTSP